MLSPTNREGDIAECYSEAPSEIPSAADTEELGILYQNTRINKLLLSIVLVSCLQTMREVSTPNLPALDILLHYGMRLSIWGQDRTVQPLPAKPESPPQRNQS